MNNNTFMKFQADVQSMANTMVTQAMCAEKGIDYNQLMQAAQMAHLQGILQQEEQKRIMKVVANHYGTQNTTGLLGRIKQAVVGEAPQPMSMNNPFMQAMVQSMAQPTPAYPANPVFPTAPATPQVDPRVEQLEQEVAGIKNDVSDIKAMLSSLANSMAGNVSNDIPLK